VERGKKGNYRPVAKHTAASGMPGYHGIVLVPDVVERTPAFIEDTIPGSPAARAGLRPDDLIVYVDGIKIASIKQFREIAEAARPGTALKLDVRRGDRLQTIELKLDVAPSGSGPRKLSQARGQVAD